MKKRLAYIVVFLCVVMGLVSCGKSQKLIPRAKMSKIYAEMFMADQWLSSNHKYLVQSDTTQFYDIVLNKYGYDSKDFRYSMEYYLQDPIRYGRILKKSAQILQGQRDRLQSKMKDDEDEDEDEEIDDAETEVVKVESNVRTRKHKVKEKVESIEE